MSEEEFWNCTHRKILALLKIHKEVTDRSSGKEKEEDYVDNIIL